MTELLLTLEAAVDSLESDFRPLDFMKEIFKSTPNLNNKEPVGGSAVVGGKRSPGCGGGYVCSAGPLAQHLGQAGHTRSTSYSVSYCMRKASGSPATDNKGITLLTVNIIHRDTNRKITLTTSLTNHFLC